MKNNLIEKYTKELYLQGVSKGLEYNDSIPTDEDGRILCVCVYCGEKFGVKPFSKGLKDE